MNPTKWGLGCKFLQKFLRQKKLDIDLLNVGEGLEYTIPFSQDLESKVVFKQKTIKGLLLTKLSVSIELPSLFTCGSEIFKEVAALRR